MCWKHRTYCCFSHHQAVMSPSIRNGVSSDFWKAATAVTLKSSRQPQRRGALSAMILCNSILKRLFFFSPPLPALTIYPASLSCVPSKILTSLSSAGPACIPLHCGAIVQKNSVKPTGLTSKLFLLVSVRAKTIMTGVCVSWSMSCHQHATNNCKHVCTMRHQARHRKVKESQVFLC